MKHSFSLRFICVGGMLAVASHAMAAVSAGEAAQLKTTLTPLGGEKAGNADGSIPAWTGGYTTVWPGYKSGDPRPDSFPDEKPLFSIDAKNYEKYQDKLSVGQIEMMKRYPDYRLDIYPTHRTMAAPQWVYDNTFANATRATLDNDGSTLKGAYGGIAFPIPKTGVEVIWNHLTRWAGEAAQYKFSGYVVNSASQVVLVDRSHAHVQFPYYLKDGSLEKYSGWLEYNYVETIEPPFRNGEFVLIHDPTDYANVGRISWQYLTGQRRVRRAPTIGFDTPNSVASGYDNFDEVLGFYGSPEKYDWKIVGKKEIYVPYNEERLIIPEHTKVLGEHFLKPDYLRFELHRVWAVEATLKPGKRHVMPRRTFYIDEDNWNVLIDDCYDGQGQLWRHDQYYPTIVPELPTVIIGPWANYNLQTNSYLTEVLWDKEAGSNYMPVAPQNPDFFSPEAMASRGVR